MRERADAMQTHGTTHGVRLAIREFASRIEAAWARESKAIATENAVLPAVYITKPKGNAVAIREALLEIETVAGEAVENGTMELPQYSKMVDIIESALSKPARNYDIYPTNEDAWRSYQLSHAKMKVAQDYIDWLFAPASERKGVDDAK